MAKEPIPRAPVHPDDVEFEKGLTPMELGAWRWWLRYHKDSDQWSRERRLEQQRFTLAAHRRPLPDLPPEDEAWVEAVIAENRPRAAWTEAEVREVRAEMRSQLVAWHANTWGLRGPSPKWTMHYPLPVHLWKDANWLEWSWQRPERWDYE